MSAGNYDWANRLMFVPSISTGFVPGFPGVSGASYLSGNNVFGISGATVGQWVDMKQTNSLCGVWVIAGACSGPLGIQVQTAYGAYDAPYGTIQGSTVSGNVFSGASPLSGLFTDPTSGLAQLPSWFSSGGILWVNSGLYQTPGGLGASGQTVLGYPPGSLPFGINPMNMGMNGVPGLYSGSWPEFASGGIAMAWFQRNFQHSRLVWLSGATQVPFLAAGFIAQLDTTGSGGGAVNAPTGTLQQNQVRV